jgi:hypothetical protein
MWAEYLACPAAMERSIAICSLVPDAYPCEAMVRDHNSPSLTGQVGYALEGGFMNTNDIVLAIDAEISRLQQAKALLTDTSSLTHAKRKRGRPGAASGSGKATSSKPAEFNVMSRKRRGMSDVGRARIAAAQKARWARFKKAAQ